MSQSVAETAKEFGVSVTFVYGCLKLYRNEIEEAWWEAEAAEKSFEEFPPDWEPDFDDWEFKVAIWVRIRLGAAGEFNLLLFFPSQPKALSIFF